jgi:hypothetical protein
MNAALDTYIEGAFHVALALLATVGCLMLAACIFGVCHALYKGATDRNWR